MIVRVENFRDAVLPDDAMVLPVPDGHSFVCDGRLEAGGSAVRDVQQLPDGRVRARFKSTFWRPGENTASGPHLHRMTVRMIPVVDLPPGRFAFIKSEYGWRLIENVAVAAAPARHLRLVQGGAR